MTTPENRPASLERLLDQYQLWRREYMLSLKLLGEWLQQHGLLAGATQDSLGALRNLLREERVEVALLGPVSGGKAELVAALFQGSTPPLRLPEAGGRPVLCPVEFGWDARLGPSVRLLPVETRSDPKALGHWRATSEAWVRLDLDPTDPAQVLRTLETLAELRPMPLEQARALGFWERSAPPAAARPDAEGRVSVPRWRYARINFPHPLLQRGLVLQHAAREGPPGGDTQLVLELLPRAQAQVLVLDAMQPVGLAELAAWLESGAAEPADSTARLVLLNHIEAVWERLKVKADVEAELARLRGSAATALDVPADKVLAASVRSGLLARGRNDPELLAASGLAAFEQALAQQGVNSRRDELRAQVARVVSMLRVEAGLMLRVRRRDLDEQRGEIEALRGKSAARLRQMLARLQQERAELDAAQPRVQALRVVHQKLLGEALDLVDTQRWKQAIEPLSGGLARAASAPVRGALVKHALAALTDCLQQAATAMTEVRQMLAAGFAQLNADHGFSLQIPPEPGLAEPAARLQALGRRIERFLASESARGAHGRVFAGELVSSVGEVVLPCFEDALATMQGWSSLCLAQLDAQWAARQQQLQQRGKAIEALLADAGKADGLLVPLVEQERQLSQVEQELQALMQRLIDGPALRA